MRIRNIGAGLALVLSTSSLSSCGPGPASTPGAAVPTVDVVPPPPATGASRVESPHPAANQQATLKCGAEECVVGKQVCCHYEPMTFDVRTATERDPNAGKSWCLSTQSRNYEELHDLCSSDPKIGPDGPNPSWASVVAKCDDSSDCGDGQVCCFRVQHAEHADAVCAAKTNCPMPAFDELCRAGTCRTTARKCTDVCSHESANIACGLSYGVCAP